MKAPASRWRKILAVGCSHAAYADPAAIKAVLKFKASFQPDRTIHLGDFIDATAFRSGAKGTKDEAKAIPPDVDAGLDFLRKLEPTDVICGNHEARVFTLQGHHNAIVAAAAGMVVGAIKTCCKELGARMVPYDGVYQGIMVGGYRYCHGVMFGEQACRDHAETFGNCVFAHTHRAGMAVGRRSDSPQAYCVGTLTKMGALDYAIARRSTLSWSQGFVWGYYNETRSQLWLHENQTGSEWLLPA